MLPEPGYNRSMPSNREESGADEKRPRRAARRSGPSPVGLLLVFTVLVAAVLIFVSMNKKKSTEAKTQDAPVADPFAGLPAEAPPPPPSERHKKK